MHSESSSSQTGSAESSTGAKSTTCAQYVACILQVIVNRVQTLEPSRCPGLGPKLWRHEDVPPEFGDFLKAMKIGPDSELPREGQAKRLMEFLYGSANSLSMLIDDLAADFLLLGQKDIADELRNRLEVIRVALNAAIRTEAHLGLGPQMSEAQQALSLMHGFLKKLAVLNDTRGAQANPPLPIDMVATSTEASSSHSEDFSRCEWNGQRFDFTPGQAAAVKAIWEANGAALRLDALREAVGSSAEMFRLDHLFRQRDADGRFVKHPAWGTMIVRGVKKGTYRLASAVNPPENHQNHRKTHTQAHT